MPDPPVASSMMDRSTVRGSVTRAERLLTKTRRLAAAPSAGDEPSAVGRYAIRGRLGAGGMGVVYEAHDTALDRPVALKLMLVDDEAERHRLRREAQALARLSHPNVVEVFEIGEHQGRPFVAMALVGGPTLSRWLGLRRRSRGEILDAFVQAGEGLAAAHAQGLVHRDFKPSNVLVGSDGRVRVVDFGLVRDSGLDEDAGSADEESPSPTPASDSGRAWNETLTKTGSMVGTPAYMSPEVLSSMPAGPASDQFSFCASLFEALYGRHPFVEGDAWSELPYNVLEGRLQRPPRLDREDKALLRIIERGLRPRPSERHESMSSLLEQLRATARRRGPWLGFVAGGATALALAGSLAGSPAPMASASLPCEEARDAMLGAWSQGRRDRLRQTWRRAGSGPGEVWARVDARLVSYADAWWGSHREACEADRSPVPVETVACLTRLAEGLDAKLAVLATPDEDLVTAAVEMVGRLEEPARCELRRRASSAVDHGVSPHAASLARIEALFQAGRYDQVAPLVEELVAETELEGSPQSRAAAKLWLGTLSSTRGEPDSAGEAFEDAYLLAKQSGQDWLAAEAAVALLRLYGEYHYRPAEAERWSGHAQAEVERIGDRVLQAGYLNARGRMLRSAGELEDALEHHQRALAIQRELLPEGHLDLAVSLFQVGTVQGLLGQITDGRRALEESMHIRQSELGPRHPSVMQPMTNLGVFVQGEGRLDEAREIYEDVLSIMEEVMPDTPLARRVPLTNLSAIYNRRGEVERAAGALERYLRGFEDAGQEVDDLTRETFSCDIAVLRMDYEDAVPRCRRAVALTEELLGPEHHDVAYRLVRLADALGRRGRVDEALAAFERTAEIHGQRPDGAESQAIALLNASYLEVERDRIDAAQVLVERARAALLERPGDSERHAWLGAEIDVSLAALRLERSGPEPEALALLREAVARAESANNQQAGGLVSALTLLAGAERRAGNSQRAREAAERALALGDTTPMRSSDLLARARFELARCLEASAGDEARARALALLAREDLSATDGFVRRERARVEAWLRARGWLERDESQP